MSDGFDKAHPEYYRFNAWWNLQDTMESTAYKWCAWNGWLARAESPPLPEGMVAVPRARLHRFVS